MENFVFRAPTEFVFGRGTESRTGELTARYGGKKALLMYGGGSAERSGLLDRVRRSLREAGVEFIESGGIRPNPTDDRVYEGIRTVRAEGVDFLLAVGGGSVIDTAKAIALGAVYDGDFWDFYSGRNNTPKGALPVGVVLTIPAAGSEGSGNSVITRLDGLHKISVRYPMVLRPVFAVMNPELTMTLPPYQTACGLADMLCHIQERYFSNTPGCEVTDSIAESIMRSIVELGPKVLEHPDSYDLRANVMWAGMLAHNGLCGVGKVEDWASHRLEHELSALYDVAHGAGLAVIVPAWMAFVGRRNPSKVVSFAVRVMGVDPAGRTDAEVMAEGIERLRAFYSALGLPSGIRELTGREPDIDALVASLHSNMGDSLGGYVSLTMDDCRSIYTSAL